MANGRTGTLINAANKFKYWDLYKDVYTILANRTGDDLPEPFLDALAKAYEQQTTATTKATGADADTDARQEAI